MGRVVRTGFVLALVALGLALGLAWERLAGVPELPAPDAAARERRARAELEARIDELEARLEEVERLPAAVEGEVRRELVPSRDALEEPIGAREPDPPSWGADGGEPARVATRAQLRRLAKLDDPLERLALARGLAASEHPLEQLAGARVLAELAPAEAHALVDGWLAEVDAGERADWYVVDAARALEQQGDPRCMATYVASLAADRGAADVATRRRAYFKLGTTRSPTVVPLLMSGLSDASAEVRIAALDALRTSGDASAIAAVAPLLDDRTAAVRDRAVRTLDTLRRRSAPEPDRPGERDPLRERLRRKR